MLKPISLIPEVLGEQDQEVQLMKAEIDSHKPGLESINTSVHDMIKNSDPATQAKLQDKLDQLNQGYQSCSSRIRDREEDLKTIKVKLSTFQDMASAQESWLVPSLETLESQEVDQMEATLLKDRLHDMRLQSEERKVELKAIQTLSDELVKHPNTGDVGHVKDKMAQLVQSWKDLNDMHADREKDVEYRENQSHKYHQARDEVIQWLDRMENKVGQLEPVAIDVEIIERQIEELQVMYLHLNK